jgi:hypothetical protein
MMQIEDHESAGLVLQESFEDELPYIPTTLPEERAKGVKLVPMKERAQMEMKVCPVERPRSTTPINPASLENYCGKRVCGEDHEALLARGEKLRISLPRKVEAIKEKSAKNTKSPRKISNASGKNWFEFAEEQGLAKSGAQGEKCRSRKNSTQSDTSPPPLPPRKYSGTAQWINFENIPEKRKPPKRITTLPTKDISIDKNSVPHQTILYNYVNPEECQCECHESEREKQSAGEGHTSDERPSTSQEHQTIEQHQEQLPEETQPLLEPEMEHHVVDDEDEA